MKRVLCGLTAGAVALGIGLALPASAEEKKEGAITTQADVAGQELEAIQIELPEAFFGGTPLDYWGPNLEPESFKARPDFLAPKGTALISKGKPVTSGAAPTHGELAQLTDGDKDYVKSSLMEFPADLQWVQVDLGAENSLYAIVLWHYHEGKRVYHDVVVQASNDPEFKEGVTVLYNNDHDNSSGLGIGTDKEYIENNKGRLMDAKGVKARYVRVYGKGNTANDFTNFVELEIFGKS